MTKTEKQIKRAQQLRKDIADLYYELPDQRGVKWAASDAIDRMDDVVLRLQALKKEEDEK